MIKWISVWSTAALLLMSAQVDLSRAGASRGNRANATDLPAIYIADSGNHRLVRVRSMAGDGWEALGRPDFLAGAAPGEFNRPSAVSLDSSGAIYVADYGNGRVVRIDDITGAGWITHGVAGAPATPRSPYAGLQSVRITSDGHILYLQDCRLMRIDDMSGRNWELFGSDNLQGQRGTGFFYGVRGFWLDGRDRIFLADAAGNRILRMLGPGGAGTTFFGREGSGEGEFRHPSQICVDRLNRIYVADYGNHRIVRMNDIDGRGWIAFGVAGAAKGQFGKISGIFVDYYFRIYVTDYENNRVIRMDDMSGAGWKQLGAEGSGIREFRGPSGICIR